jgi:hypothetical protein
VVARALLLFAAAIAFLSSSRNNGESSNVVKALIKAVFYVLQVILLALFRTTSY